MKSKNLSTYFLISNITIYYFYKFFRPNSGI